MLKLSVSQARQPVRATPPSVAHQAQTILAADGVRRRQCGPPCQCANRRGKSRSAGVCRQKECAYDELRRTTAPSRKPAKERQPLAEFRARVGDEDVEIPADLRIECEINGRRQSKTIDQLVKLAQRGHFNEERRNAILRARLELELRRVFGLNEHSRPTVESAADA